MSPIHINLFHLKFAQQSLQIFRFKLSEANPDEDRAVDCGLALVHALGVWSLGLRALAHIRPENALRNQVWDPWGMAL